MSADLEALRKAYTETTYKLGYIAALVGVGGDEPLEVIKERVRERMADVGTAEALKSDNARLRREVARHQERFEALFAWAKLNTRLDPQHATLEQMLQDAVAFEREQHGLQLAACDCAAMMDTEETHAQNNTVTRDNPSWSHAFESVMRRTAECIKLRTELAAARELMQQLLNVAENCDETGYADGVGFVDVDALHEKVRAWLAKEAK